MEFKDRMVAIDTKSKSFNNPHVEDPPFVLVWEISIVSLTQKLKARKDKNKVYTALMRPSYSTIHKEKLPSRISDTMWETARNLEDEQFQEELKKELDQKFWVGWDISRIGVENIRTIFTKITPPSPVGIFDVLNWAMDLDVKKSLCLPNLRLYTVAHYLEIKNKQLHRAEEDALLCVEVFQGLIHHKCLTMNEVYEIMQSCILARDAVEP